MYGTILTCSLFLVPCSKLKNRSSLILDSLHLFPPLSPNMSDLIVKKKIVTNEAEYWNSFYDHKFAVAVPSQFCCLVAIEAPKTRPFVEFGCGNGRDSKVSCFSLLWFKTYGCRLLYNSDVYLVTLKVHGKSILSRLRRRSEQQGD